MVLFLGLGLNLLLAINHNFDSLPPLPNPYDVELRLTIPEEKLIIVDTIELFISGGMAVAGQSTQFFYPLKGEIKIPWRKRDKFFLLGGNYLSDIDYGSFYNFKIFGFSYIPIRRAFFDNSLSVERKSRAKTFYDNIAFDHWSVHPVFLGELNPKFIARLSRFSTLNYFYYFDCRNDYFMPTGLGNFSQGLRFLIQTNTSITGMADLSDYIILKEFILIKPKITWWFIDQLTSASVDFGARIRQSLITYQFVLNDKSILPFDTLYCDAGPFQVSSELTYPIRNWSMLASWRLKNQGFNLRLSEATNQIHYIVTPESLIMPENSGKKSKAIGIDIKNALGGFKNYLTIEFNLTNLSLTPSYKISDCLNFSLKRFQFILNSSLIGRRRFNNYELKPNFRLNTEFNYSYSFANFGIGFHNILGSVWEVYPFTQDTRRKLFLQVRIYKNF